MPRSCADRGGQGMGQGPGRMSYGGKEPRPLATSGTDPGIVGHDGPAHRWCARARGHTQPRAGTPAVPSPHGHPAAAHPHPRQSTGAAPPGPLTGGVRCRPPSIPLALRCCDPRFQHPLPPGTGEAESGGRIPRENGLWVKLRNSLCKCTPILRGVITAHLYLGLRKRGDPG